MRSERIRILRKRFELDFDEMANLAENYDFEIGAILLELERTALDAVLKLLEAIDARTQAMR